MSKFLTPLPPPPNLSRGKLYMAMSPLNSIRGRCDMSEFVLRVSRDLESKAITPPPLQSSLASLPLSITFTWQFRNRKVFKVWLQREGWRQHRSWGREGGWAAQGGCRHHGGCLADWGVEIAGVLVPALLVHPSILTFQSTIN